MRPLSHIVIAGEQGYLGSQLAQIFQAKNLTVLGLNEIDMEASAPDQRLEGATFINCVGISDVKACELEPEKAFESNVYFVDKSLQFCAKNNVGRFIHLSSSLVYDRDYPSPYSENNPTRAVNTYAETKLRSEDLVMESAFEGRKYVLRLGNIIGKSTKQNTLLSKILEAYKRKYPLTLFNGVATRDYLSVNDFADLIALIHKNKFESDVLNVGSGVGYSVTDVLQIFSEVFGYAVPCAFAEELTPGADTIVLEISKIQRKLSWSPVTRLNQIINAISQ